MLGLGYTSQTRVNLSPIPIKKADANTREIGLCENFGTVKKGDSMRIEAWYDANKYPLMSHNGKKERLMGIMRVFIGPNQPAKQSGSELDEE